MSTLRLFRPATSSIARFSAVPLSRPAFRSFHATGSKMTIHNIETAEDFKTTIAKRPVVLIDWFATWCGPCKQIAPRLAKLAEENTDITFAKVDIDELPDLAGEYGISAMPTFTVFKKGKPVDTFTGAHPLKLAELVAKNKPEAEDAEAKDAETKDAEAKDAESKDA